jgi:hypothetical protein
LQHCIPSPISPKESKTGALAPLAPERRATPTAARIAFCSQKTKVKKECGKYSIPYIPTYSPNSKCYCWLPCSEKNSESRVGKMQAAAGDTSFHKFQSSLEPSTRTSHFAIFLGIEGEVKI